MSLIKAIKVNWKESMRRGKMANNPNYPVPDHGQKAQDMNG
jgi:hypothetical protein